MEDRFVSKVRELLHQSGVDPKIYAGHSFRIGSATTASRQGVNEATIKMICRWESSAYLRYIKTPRAQLASISASSCVLWSGVNVLAIIILIL